MKNPGSGEPSKARTWPSKDTELAFIWLTAAGSMQVEQLEDAMRNYPHPQYNVAEIGKQLVKVLASPAVQFGGASARVDPVALAEAVIEFAISSGWDVVRERSFAD